MTACRGRVGGRAFGLLTNASIRRSGGGNLRNCEGAFPGGCLCRLNSKSGSATAGSDSLRRCTLLSFFKHVGCT